MILSFSSFEGCFALQNGVFKFIGGSYFDVYKTNFKKNYAEMSNSIGQIITASPNSIFYYSNFKDN